MHEAGGALWALGSALRRLPAALRTPPGRRRALTALGSTAALVLLAMAGSGPDLPDRVTAASSTMPATSTTHAPARVTTAPATTDRDDDAPASEWTPSAHFGPRTATATTVAETTTTVAPPPTEPAPPTVDPDAPAVVARPIPSEPPPPPPAAPPPPWAGSTRTTGAGHVAVDVGCSRGRSASAIDVFLRERVGPVIGWDYQHVYPLGGDRYLWLFQDAFVDHSGTAATLDRASFVHNTAMLQQGSCFTLLHRGTTSRPAPFEAGAGGGTLSRWYWPMGGELSNGRLQVFWAEMVKDGYDPDPPDGLGWHPVRTWLATYDAGSLARLSFVAAADPSASPIYGYAVASDATHSYLFGNTFEQNMVREGGFWNGPHSATYTWLARVPRGQLGAAPEYRTADGWSPNRADARPIMQRFFAEDPFQPRFLDGRWVAVSKVDGYWGERLAVDVANDPWGPWTSVQSSALWPRGNDPLMNTYHAHLLPWRDPSGALAVTVSNNARNMLRDAWPHPQRYRPMAVTAVWAAPPPRPEPTTTTAASTTTTAATTTSTTTTTVAPTTTTAPTTTSTTSTTTSTTTTTTSTTVVPTSTTAPP